MKKNNMTDIRSRLKKRESSLRANIEDQTSRIEGLINNNLTKVAIIGAGALTAYVLFKSLSSNGSQKKNKGRKNSKFGGVRKSEITQKILSTALKTAIPVIIDKIKTKDQKES